MLCDVHAHPRPTSELILMTPLFVLTGKAILTQGSQFPSQISPRSLDELADVIHLE